MASTQKLRMLLEDNWLQEGVSSQVLFALEPFANLSIQLDFIMTGNVRTQINELSLLFWYYIAWPLQKQNPVHH